MECFWPNTFETTYPKSDIRKYTNKVRMSDSVFKGKEATKQQKERFPRPADKGNASPVFVYGGVGLYDDESLFLKRINASLGSSKQIHTILMVFGKDEPRSVVDDVLTAWQGPNKNELVTFVSVDGKDVRWVEVHSWMDNTALHAMLRDEIAGEPFSIMRYGELLRKYVPSMWVRKKFTPLNEYLRVPIPAGYVVWAIVLSIAVGIGSYFGISRFLAPTRGYGYR
jgi:hypothetical protein